MGVNDSPISKRRPTVGADPADLPDDRRGGNKDSVTGGSRHEFNPTQGALEKGANANDGFEAFDPGSNSDEDSGGPGREQGSTLTKAGLT